MNDPKVSVIIPSHNKGLYIMDSIMSAINQTWNNIEVIIVDDNSHDNTHEIINQIRNNKIKFYSVNFNNASATRNFGMQKSYGDFVQFLDADDILHPKKIETQLYDMDFKDDVLGVANTSSFYNNIDELKKEVDTEFLKFSSDPFLFINNLYKAVDSGMVQPNAWLVPRKLINITGFWNETLSVDDDGEFFCRVILESREIIHTDKVLNFYRKYKVSGSNLSAKRNKLAFFSMLNSAILKKKYLEEYVIKNKIDFNLTPIFNPLFVNIMVASYPMYKDISILAKKHIDYNEVLVLPKLGGKVIEFIKKITSWKIAKQIQYIIKE